MERLHMQEIIDIVYRLRKGESQRAIAAALNHHRATVRQYHFLAKQKGFLDTKKALPTEADILCALGEPANVVRPLSSVQPFSEIVKSWLSKGVEVRAIHRMLTQDHGFTGSYSAVRRFAVAHRPDPEPDAYVRIETDPGEDAQIDFGTVGHLLDPTTGKLRLAYCFVMTLCFSRHQYVEFVFDQRIGTWIGCHRRAFAYFGGCARRLVIDNLKAAVIKAALEDAVLGSAYRQMARHYDVLIAPCRPRTPEHKGKVESGVHFVKRNLWPELAGMTLPAANTAANNWVMGYAGHRDHGTTHEQPLLHFQRTEAATLLPLPAAPFDLLEVRVSKVHKDCHLVVDGSYYPAPYQYVGKRLDVYIREATVQIYYGVELLATHERAKQRGERIERPDFYPPHKARYLARTKNACMEEATRIGPACLEIAQTILDDKPRDSSRVLAALVGLADRHTAQQVEAACAFAIACADPRYMRVRDMLRNAPENLAMSVAKTTECLCESVSPVYHYARGAEEFFGDLGLTAKGVQQC